LARRYFGTDGVRGIVGEFLTPELVERLGRAAATWTGASKVFVGRDTRASGRDLEEAFARGVISVGGDAILGGVLPTPAVALLALDLGVVISASHNPPEYNGVKFFDSQGHKLSDRSEEQIEELLASSPGIDQGRIEHIEVATDSYLQHILDRFGSDLGGLRIAVDCANGAYSGLAPHAFEQCGATVHAIGDAPNGENINVGCGATDLALLQQTVVDGGYDLGIAFDGDGDRMLAVDENGEVVDGDQIVAILARDLARRGRLPGDLVVVTSMSNLGFHRAMRRLDLETAVTDVGDRYVLEEMRKSGCNVGGEQSGHIILADHSTTGDGLVAGLQVLAALVEAKAPASALLRQFEPLPQLLKNVRFNGGSEPLEADIVRKRIAAAEAELEGRGRLVIRKSGTEPLIRVMAEGEDFAVVQRLVDDICEAVQSAA
jgi:phosphoglucosamine mutase